MIGVIQIVAFSLGAFALTFGLVAWASRVFFVGLWQKPLWAILAILFGITHFLLASAMAVHIGIGLKREALLGMAWTLFIYMDFPVSFLIWPIGNLVDALIHNSKIAFWFSSLITPYVLFATLGSLQYGLWGALLGKLLERLRG